MTTFRHVSGGLALGWWVLTLTASAGLVGGTLAEDTHWTTNDSPYVLTRTVTVVSNATLTIDPGVVVQFFTNGQLLVRGALLAEGTPEDPIRFTREPSVSRRGGVRIQGYSRTQRAGGHLRHVDFREMSFSPGALSSQYADIALADANIEAITGTAVHLNESRIAVLRSLWNDTGEALNAVRCAGLIASNRITNVEGNADAIDIDFGWLGAGDPTLVLEWNDVEGGPHSNADGIDFGSCANVILRYNTVRDFGDKGFSIGEGSQLIAYNNLIRDCATGVAIKDSSEPILMHLTIADCGVGIDSFEKNAGWGGGLGSISNAIIWNCPIPIQLDALSQLDVGYCLIQDAPPWPGPGNRTDDPEFRDPGADNFRLRPGSPAIDAGLTFDSIATLTDLDGNPRLAGAGVDLGAYEYTPGALDANLIGAPRQGIIELTAILTAHVAGLNTNGLVYAWDLDGDGRYDLAGPDLNTVTGHYTRLGLHSVGLRVANHAEIAAVFREDYLLVSGPDTVFASPTGGHVPPFIDWGGAATNIQEAIDVVNVGGQVRVAAGHYTLPAPGLRLARPVAVVADEGPGATLLQAPAGQRVATLTHEDARLEGFTITGGFTNQGGGVYLTGGATLRGCIVSNNTATAAGGGLYLLNLAHVEQCEVVDNRTQGSGIDGGGAYIAQSGMIKNTRFRNNTAADDGGGLYSNNGGLITHCVFTDNRASDKGGGIFLSGSSVAANCLVVGNQAGTGVVSGGGGVSCLNGGTFEYCTVVSNRATGSGRGGGLFNQGGGRSFNTIYWGNTASLAPEYHSTNGVDHAFAYCLTQPLPTGAGNRDTAPAFADALAGNYRLMAGSTGIDAGTNRLAGMPDLDGVPRPLDGDTDGIVQADMGAYEFMHPTADSDGDGFPDAAEWIAGTSLLDAADYFAIREYVHDPEGMRLGWDSVTGRLYTVFSTTNVQDEGSWTIDNQIAGDDGPLTHTGTPPPSEAAPVRYHRLGVEILPPF